MSATNETSDSQTPSATTGQEVDTELARKVRWTVPAGDTSVKRWLDVQDNISVSLRLLIREQIQREGYTDVLNRPVEQLPRRGRPPREETSQSSAPVAHESAAPANQLAPAQAADISTDDAADATSAAPEPAAPAAPGSSDPVDMDEIFGHRS